MNVYRRRLLLSLAGLVATGGLFVAGCSRPAATSQPSHDQHAETNGSPSSHASNAISDPEQQLYLTPGGHYTEADIAANGNVTAAVKFKGLKPAHDKNPQPGDHICPISGTKASSRFSWVIGGQRYEFCCPPCVEEFLREAKEGKTELQLPESYIKGA